MTSCLTGLDRFRGRILLAETMEAHGGEDRWAAASTITTTVQVRGLMPTTMFPGRSPDDCWYRQTIDVHRQRAVLRGFPTPGVTCTVTPDQVEVEHDGQVSIRRYPRDAFTHGFGAIRRVLRWDTIDAAYFVGYAMANYLSQPYNLGRRDITVRRGPDWRRPDGNIWRRLWVRYPPAYATHCPKQTFFVDEHGLLPRHEYVPDIYVLARIACRVTGGYAAHFSTRHREHDGLVLPTFRRVMVGLPGPTRWPLPGVTMICAQLSDITIAFGPTEAPADPAHEHGRRPLGSGTDEVPR